MLFERVLIEFFSDHLISVNVQFVFRKGVDSPNAIFDLKQLVHFPVIYLIVFT